MNRAEKNLLASLRNRVQSNSEEPLRNIKNALGSIGKMNGNPLTKNELSITTDVFFCDPTNPAVLLPPAAVPPPNFGTTLPIYYFGLTDMYGAYQKARFINPLNPVWYILANGFINYDFRIATAVAVPVAFLNICNDGDYVIVYDQNVGGIPIMAMVRIRCQNVAYSTLVHSLMSDIIYINTIRYNVGAASILQFTHSLNISYLSTFGKIQGDTIDPRLYVLPTSPQQTISDIPIKSPFDKSMIIGTQIDFTCQHFTFILFVEKIEVLTKRL